MGRQWIILFFCWVFFLQTGCMANELTRQPASAVVFPHGNVAHIVAEPLGPLEQRAVSDFANYLSQVTRKPAEVMADLDKVPGGHPVIFISNAQIVWPFTEGPDQDCQEAYCLQTGQVKGHPVMAVSGTGPLGLKRGLQRLTILSEQQAQALFFPRLEVTSRPWIAKREWTLCPWEPTRVRGVFYNPYVDRRLNIYSYSQLRLQRYVEMFDWFGFSGCQLIETCATYAAFGEQDAAQEWLGSVLDMLERNGQEASLWVWAAQFTGYHWNDPQAEYRVTEGQRAFHNPKIRSIFEKHYDGYVKHADRLDRLIGHFYDPGALTKREDVFDFMRLLESKAKARNPEIKMGIDTWAAGSDYFQTLIENGFEDYLILAVAIPISYQGDAREQMHQAAKDLGLHMGYWGWYQTEMETDQMPSLFVNAKVLKDFYNRLRQGAVSIYPVNYYSEMEAHHLNNIYSMYAAGQLLWDPQRDPDQILAELTRAIWGPQNGPIVLEALQLIQDVRSGPTWETYWWTSPQYRLGTENPQADLQRAKACILALTEMKSNTSFVVKIPLPYPPETFVELMMPHLRQIRHFSQFRVDVNAIKKAAQAGADKNKLQDMLQKAWQPVPEYDTWVGVFGLPELRMQRQIVADLRKTYGIEVPDPAHLVYREAHRVLEQIRYLQSARADKFYVETTGATWQFWWPKELAHDRFQYLVDQSVLVPAKGGVYHLADWENWALPRKVGF